MTGEMSREEVTPESYPLHFAIAKEFGGTVEPFDKYQGPYIDVDGARLWLCSDDGAHGYIYNDENDRKSDEFPSYDAGISERLAVEAARSVLASTLRMHARKLYADTWREVRAPGNGVKLCMSDQEWLIVERFYEKVRRDGTPMA